MMRRTLGLLAILAVTFLACGGDDDGGGITDEQRQLVMGQTEGIGLFFSALTDPLVLSRDNVHSNVRPFDLNSDGVDDISIRAFQDFNGDRGLTISTENDSTVVSVTADGVIKALEEGDIVTLTTETWSAADQLPLAVRESGNTTGVWNMQGRRYVAVRMDIGNSRFLAWIELSVEDFDDYSFYNLALRTVP